VRYDISEEELTEADGVKDRPQVSFLGGFRQTESGISDFERTGEMIPLRKAQDRTTHPAAFFSATEKARRHKGVGLSVFSARPRKA
jgi:hypothetical protein